MIAKAGCVALIRVMSWTPSIPGKRWSVRSRSTVLPSRTSRASSALGTATTSNPAASKGGYATDNTLVFLTNHLTFGAATIAAIYKDRWQVELFFKAPKQNLKIKTFVGTSANALKVQVWTALIAMLLLQLRARFAWSLSNLLALLRMNLFTHRDLWAWLEEPYTAPPPLEAPEQEALALG